MVEINRTTVNILINITIANVTYQLLNYPPEVVPRLLQSPTVDRVKPEGRRSGECTLGH